MEIMKRGIIILIILIILTAAYAYTKKPVVSEQIIKNTPQGFQSYLTYNLINLTIESELPLSGVSSLTYDGNDLLGLSDNKILRIDKNSAEVKESCELPELNLNAITYKDYELLASNKTHVFSINYKSCLSSACRKEECISEIFKPEIKGVIIGLAARNHKLYLLNDYFSVKVIEFSKDFRLIKEKPLPAMLIGDITPSEDGFFIAGSVKTVCPKNSSWCIQNAYFKILGYNESLDLISSSNELKKNPEGFYGDRLGLAYDKTYLFIADYYNSRLYKILLPEEIPLN